MDLSIKLSNHILKPPVLPASVDWHFMVLLTGYKQIILIEILAILIQGF